MQNIYYYETLIGNIGIVANEKAVTRLYFHGETDLEKSIINESLIIKEAGSQLKKYLSGQLRDFSLPLAPSGTPFMISVWEQLCRIPFGQTRSYKNIAIDLGNPNAARAVGLANNKNPIPIFIPCHRVIGTNGKLVGFRGGLSVKDRLLKLERDYSL